MAGLEGAGLRVGVFDRVQGNPRDLQCLEGAERARALRAEVIVGVGGGSAIDTAKCIAVLVANGGHARDWEDFGALRTEPLPTIALPTTAALAARSRRRRSSPTPSGERR